MAAETEAARAAPRRTWGKMQCPECGRFFMATHHRQAFCSPQVESKVWNARQKVRGQQISMLAQAWRLGRNTRNPKAKGAAGDAFTDLCRLLDQFSAEDKAAGRPNALEVIQRQNAMNVRG